MADVRQAKQVFGQALSVMQIGRLAGHALADCLDWVAAITDMKERPRDAAVLFGAADAQWQASGGFGTRLKPNRFDDGEMFFSEGR